ncbi:jerky protein homolog-like [Colletes gigas]|uniref:jerky protein homolog-like n=1 Tax=Colletes gigas TaxID=935657 RepID=UPI001C9B265D|nr:jerky protein homolog-like [Colletes gigas]
MELYNEIGGTSSFTASRGWLTKFKRRHNIRLLHVHGEAGSADEESAERFLINFAKKVEEEGIEEHNNYNMDESGLMWKAIPSKTLVHCEEHKIEGKKMKKDRVTIGLCANATGTHKLPLLFIYKYQNPRALKNCGTLPVVYTFQKQAWVNRQIFADWYENHFKSSVKQYQLENKYQGKTILLVDNCQGHIIETDDEEEQFEIIFLPPNTTSIIEPMDQGIIAKLKKRYRHKMLRHVLTFPGGLNEFYSRFTIKDCIFLVRDAWEDVTSNDIKNGWNKIFTKDSEDSSEDALNTTIDSEISELIHTINGEPINQELLNDFFLLLDQVENMDITEQEGEADIEEEIEGGDERHGEEEEEEQHREEEAVTELETSQELPIIQANENLEERKLRELQWIDTLIKNWGNNKPHVQIMGEAFKKKLEAEALPEN